MAPVPRTARLRAALRRQERRLAALWLAATALAVAIVALPPTRRPLLDALQGGLVRWDGRWSGRLARGEALAAAGRHAEAVAHLERLDRVFPARHAKHRRDLERERLLETLGASQTALDRKRRALETYRALAAFDPRNWRNHFLHAEAALHFRETDEALAGYAAVLRIHPTHAPSLARVIELAAARGDSDAVTAAYERYLDAFLLVEVPAALGEWRGTLGALADGRWRAAELVVARPPGWSGELVLGPSDSLFEVRSLRLEPGRRAGRLPETTPFALADPAALRIRDGALRVAIPPQPDGVARLALELRLVKPIGAEEWRAVQQAYRNRLDWDGLEAARARTPAAGEPHG